MQPSPNNALCGAIWRVARKLEITEWEAWILCAVNRGVLGKWGYVVAMRALATLVAKYNLSDSEFEPTYANQLYQKGILTEEEASVLDNAVQNGASAGTPHSGLGSNGNHTQAELLAKFGVSSEGPDSAGISSEADNPRRSPPKRRSRRRTLARKPAKRHATRSGAVRKLPDANVDARPQD